jgi:hypothetical protein
MPDHNAPHKPFVHFFLAGLQVLSNLLECGDLSDLSPHS